MYITQPWYTPAEVAIHNKPSDCWVALNGKVLNVTSWLENQFKICTCVKHCSCPVKNWFCSTDCVEFCNCFKRGFFYCDAKRLAMSIVAFAGKDISHWFKGENWLCYTHPVAGLNTTFHQFGHMYRRPVVPSTRWRAFEKPWWNDENLVIGKATSKTRPIRITNTITGSTVTLEVCKEETLYQIMMRYLPHNSHMMSYAWRYMGNAMCYDRTLAENGVPDERETFQELLLPENNFIPTLLIYYNDDLTEDPEKETCPCYERRECIQYPDTDCRVSAS